MKHIETKREKINKIQAFIKVGDLASAEQLCNTCLNEYPTAWRFPLLMANIHHLSLSPKKMMSFIQKAQVLGAPVVDIAKFKEKIYSDNRDINRHRETVELLIAEQPDVPRWYIAYVNNSIEAKQPDQVMDALQRFYTRFPDTRLPFQNLVKILEFSQPNDFIAKIADIIDNVGDKWELRMARALAHGHNDNIEYAWLDIVAACKIDPDIKFPNHINALLNVHVGKRTWNVGHLEKAFSDNPRSASLLWQLATVYDRAGDLDKFRQIIDENAHWAAKKYPEKKVLEYMVLHLGIKFSEDEVAPQSRRRLALLNQDYERALFHSRGSDEEDILNELIHLPPSPYKVMDIFDSSRDIFITGQGRPNGVVLIFSGMGGKPGMSPKILDEFLARLGLSAIFLSDFKRLCYLNGVGSLGNSLTESIEALRDFVADFAPGKPVYTFSNSAGSPGALLFGQALKMRAALLFSPFSVFDPNKLLKMDDKRARITFMNVLDKITPPPVTVSECLANMEPGFLASVYCGEYHPEDRLHADLIAKMPNTKLYLLKDFKGHGAVGRASRDHGFMNVLKSAYGLD